ncbi:MAG TPA: protein kinase [Kofleriaceae bacterium]
METIGRYRVVRPLGHGGMGDVYLAHDPTLERDVALKLLHREVAHGGLREEAKALAALSHPSIVTVFEIGEHDGRDFIAMEYLPGRSLRDVLAGHAPRAQLLAICSKVAIAVEAAHRAGLLHRDVKPENVVVGERGDVKVVDFGLARRLEREDKPTRAATAHELVAMFTRTMPIAVGTDTEVSAGTQTVFGTPAYMAPEVMLGEQSTAASDIYSLGVVVFECLAYRRPYDATSLVEMIASTIDGGPPAVDDPLGPLVARMLARDPTQRPTLDDVARELTSASTAVPAPRPRKRWPFAAAGALVAAALAVGGWAAARGLAGERGGRSDDRGARTIAATAPITASIAIAPLAVELPSYGRELPSAPAIADTLARLLGQIDGARLTGLATSSATDPRSAARALGAGYVATGRIDERAHELHAHLELVSVASGATVAAIDLARPIPQLAALLDDSAISLSRALAPAAVLPPAPNPLRARMFYDEAKPLLDAGRFSEVRVYLEQAVDADPSLADAWSGLVLVCSWMEAPETEVADAAAHSIALAPDGPQKQLMRGIAAFLNNHYADARAFLEPLDRDANAAMPGRRELLYYLGESNWHDGRFGPAFDYFKRTNDFDRNFRPASVHAWEYAVAHRDAKSARYFIGLAGERAEWIELALGHLQQVADEDKPPFSLWADLLLDRPVPTELEDAFFAGDELQRASYHLGRVAGTGDTAAARAAFAELWDKQIAHRTLPPGAFFALESIGETLLVAQLGDETRQLVALLAAQSHDHPVRGYQRLSNLAAMLLGDPSLVVRDGANERTVQLADAADAVLAKDHVKAAAILGKLVADPSFEWDYPERAQLLHELRALGRRGAIATLCADSTHPALFRPAALALRQQCSR